MTGSADIPSSDLIVSPVSNALNGWKLDVVVSGSIGAVESVKFVRALRRLSCSVTPWLTRGGAEFITAQSLSWAAGRETVTGFSGAASHIATADGCIVAPASASLIGKVAHGITDSPAAALVASYLGMGKPVLMLPNMHDSLYRSPAVQNNLKTLESYGVTILGARTEEGKQKFPASDVLADICSYNLLAPENGTKKILVTMGTTRGYIDDVRYISNYSSGALGTAICSELYRHGFETLVVCGPCQIKPVLNGKMFPVETNDDMERAIKAALAQGACASVLAASVLDFAPETKQSGKIKSATNETLTVTLNRTKKLISEIKTKIKVGFKLETGLTDAKAVDLAQEYIKKYDLSMFVVNDLSDVGESKHLARTFDGKDSIGTAVTGKSKLAQTICQHIIDRAGK